jgi:hypothetical protein
MLRKKSPFPSVFRHRKRCAVGPGQQLVGVRISGEPLCLGIEVQRPAESIRGVGQIQTRGIGQVSLHILERFVGQLVVPESLRAFVEGHLFAQANAALVNGTGGASFQVAGRCAAGGDCREGWVSGRETWSRRAGDEELFARGGEDVVPVVA